MVEKGRNSRLITSLVYLESDNEIDTYCKEHPDVAS